MRIFLDTAETSLIEEYFQTGLIDGVTTNPTLIKKSGKEPEDVYQKIKDIGLLDISMEIVAEETLDMVAEGRRLKEKYGECTTIKLPCTRKGLRACKILAEERIRVNITLVFSVAQAILAAKSGAAYISPFVGRVDDNGFDGIDLITKISALYREQMARTQVLSASIRDVNSVSKSFGVGADIVTMPPAIFDKMYNHILTDKGVELFNQDWEKVKSNES